MAQIQKLESETLELKCPADKFYDVYRNNQYLLCKFCPENYKSVQVLEGDGKSVGTVRHWKWVQGDNPNVLSCDEKLKAVDDKNMSITFGVYDGDLMNNYETFDLILSVTPNKGRSIGSGSATGCSVKWCVEYEKKNQDVPPPKAFIDLMVKIGKELEGHLLEA